jgi:hypothetical protein
MKNTCVKKKMDKICARLETSPRKIFGMTCTAKCMNASSPQNTTRLLHLHPHDSCVSQKPQHSIEAKVLSINWYLQGVYAQEFYPILVLVSDESLFHLLEYVTSQSNV